MSNLEDRIVEVLGPDVDPGDLGDEAREAWRIDGTRTADWAARKLARARRRIQSARTIAEAEIRAITEWLQHETRDNERDARFFEAKLQEWHEDQLIAGEEGKTIRLPAATLSIRAGRTHVEVDDEEALTQWLEEHLDRPDEALDYTVKPRLSVLSKRFAAKVDKVEPGEYPLVDPSTMEILPGARIVRAGHTFSVKTVDEPAEDRGEGSGAETAREATA